MHQGYVAAWFGIPADPDPICWYFGEGDTEVPVERGTFSSVLFAEFRAVIPFLEKE